MKIRIFALLFAVVLPVLSGCSLYTAAVQQDTIEPRIETPTMAPVAPEGALTEEEAVAIALERADLAADQISGLRVRYEVDDGVPEYEIEFRYNRQEYDYTIHAETGEVLSSSQDD